MNVILIEYISSYFKNAYSQLQVIFKLQPPSPIPPITVHASNIPKKESSGYGLDYSYKYSIPTPTKKKKVNHELLTLGAHA